MHYQPSDSRYDNMTYRCAFPSAASRSRQLVLPHLPEMNGGEVTSPRL